VADTGLTAQLRLNNADRQADRQTDTRQMLGAYRIVRSTGLGVQNVEVIVRPLSTVEYTSVASLFHCRQRSD